MEGNVRFCIWVLGVGGWDLGLERGVGGAWRGMNMGMDMDMGMGISVRVSVNMSVEERLDWG